MADKTIRKNQNPIIKIKKDSPLKKKILFDLSIIIPVYNEENTIRSIINEIIEIVEESNHKYEILVINDGSTDSTCFEIEKTSVEYIELNKNRGKGSALRRGFNLSKGRILLTVDADGSHQPKDIRNTIDSFFNNKYQMLIGSRFARKSKYQFTTSTNIVGNKLFSILIFILSGKLITDSQSGLRIFDKRIIQNTDIKSKGYEIEAELTALALGAGYKVGEIPIDCKPREYGSSHLSAIRDGFKILITIIKSYYRNRN